MDGEEELDVTNESMEFAPMENMRAVRFNLNDSGSGIEDHMIGGVHIPDQFRHHLHSDLGSDGAVPSTSGGGDGSQEYDVALGKFMRNEINYDEFMRTTGGQTIEEEMADGAGMEDTEDEDEEEQEFYDDELSQGEASEPGPSSSQGPRPKKSKSTSDLPPQIRSFIHEVVSDELVVAKIEPEETKGRFPLLEVEKPEKLGGGRKLNKTMDALLGQANLIYARGQTAEAITMLLEVIRQEPRSAEAYRQISDIYQETGESQKSLQYGLLAAYLDSRTLPTDWVHWGDMSKNANLFEEAAACYARALRLDPANWIYYEKRIEMLDLLGLRPLAMKTRLQAAQLISHAQANVDFDWFHDLIKTVAHYYITINDEDRAILALEAFVLRSKEFGKPAEAQHETLIRMWMAKEKYVEAAKSIFALCDGIICVNSLTGEAALQITLSNGTYSVEPFPPPSETKFLITKDLSTAMLTRVIVCFITYGEIQRDYLAKPLVKDVLLKRDLTNKEDEPYLLEIARVYFNNKCYKSAKVFLDCLQAHQNYCENAEMWFVYGNTLSSLNDFKGAMLALEKSLELQPSHVDARINLSGLQQKAGMVEKALETLQDYDLDTCTHLPDERLLIRQADVLFDEQKKEQFVRCVRMLLAPHFYLVHKLHDAMARKKHSRVNGVHLSNTLRVSAMNAIKDTNWEKFVKRLGGSAIADGRNVDELDSANLHDYCLKLIECLLEMKRYQDLLVVCCYSFLQPKITKSEKSMTFQNLLYFCATKANSWPLAFEYVRWFHTLTNTNNIVLLPNENRDVLYKRIFNAMNYVFVHSQNVSYHRYVMRALAKAPGNHALQAISGNNSLITGTYRHALVWHHNKKNPLICLLLALTFTHMSCKKDLSSRHMIAARGIAFMKKYEKTRTCKQETYYNIGRMFHQLSILTLAIHFYEKVLTEPALVVHTTDEEGNDVIQESDRYDLRSFAAHNLALIYRTSGNDYLARRVYEQYLVV